MTELQIAGFVTAGLAAGIFSGSLGVGGALLATPLIRFMGVTPYLAIGTTVPVLLPTTLTGAWTYARSGLVDVRTASWTALGGSAGAVAGALLTRSINGHALMLFTAATMFFLAFRLLPKAATGPSSTESGSVDAASVLKRHHPAAIIAVGLLAGFFSGLLGIGGGFLMVPAFVRLFNLPIKTALGTSLAVITLTAIPNLLAHMKVGNIDWAVSALLSLGVIPGAFLGARLAIKAPEDRLRMVIFVAIVVVAVVYAAIELSALFS